ncbi:MAG: glycosyltransferase [bacterium]|nr:glycosyltransferase [bacterium]
MSRKKILVINPATLFPVTMMSQVRTLNLIKRFCKDHQVDVATFYRNERHLALSREGFAEIGCGYHPIEPLNPSRHYFRRKYYGIKSLAAYYLEGKGRFNFYLINKKITRQLIELVNRNLYDIVQVEYCYLAHIFHLLPPGIFKVLDTHEMMEEKKEAYLNTTDPRKISSFKKREYDNDIKLQYRHIGDSDLVITISRKGSEIMEKISPASNCLLIPIGQDIAHFSEYKTAPGQNTLLFFGGMGSEQNIRAFFRLWDGILPLIKKKIPGIKLLVVGSHPPEKIKRLHNGKDVIVTGYVEDPREYLAKANVKIIPLDIGHGFRGRIVEVMAMGIPVIGTHNALDCIEMTHGGHGFITDSNGEMADHAVRLLQNPEQRDKMSKECVQFAAEKYSNEATAGKLSTYYKNLETK